MQGEEDDSVYESMAHLSTDLLMKCSLNPGCDDELYESMANFAPDASDDLCMYRLYVVWSVAGRVNTQSLIMLSRVFTHGRSLTAFILCFDCNISALSTPAALKDGWATVGFEITGIKRSNAFIIRLQILLCMKGVW